MQRRQKTAGRRKKKSNSGEHLEIAKRISKKDNGKETRVKKTDADSARKRQKLEQKMEAEVGEAPPKDRGSRTEGL